MADLGTLALVAHAATLKRLPADARVLPLEPTLEVEAARRVAPFPEDLLTRADEAAVEQMTARTATDWWRGAGKDAWTWRNVNLAECFGFALGLGIRDLLKTSILLDRVLDRERPRILLTDMKSMEDALPAYPYLDSLASLAAGRAKERDLQFEVLQPQTHATPGTSESAFRRAYMTLATRRALALLRSKRPLVALGPYPDFYIPVAEAWKDRTETTIVVTTARRPVRSVPSVRLAVATLDAFVDAPARQESNAFVRQALAALEGLAPPTALGEARDELWPSLKEELRMRFAQDLGDLTSAGFAFENGLERASHLLLMETASPLARAMVRYAGAAKVPVAVIQHGILVGAFSYRETEGDRIAAWGPADAEWFRKNLGRPVRVDATGSPRYDALRATRPGRLLPPLDRLPSKTPLVTFASQPFVQDRALRSPWDRHRALRMALEAARDMEHFALVIKWHPAEDPEALPPEAFTTGRIFEILRGDTFAILRRTQVLLAISSTVALEAMYLECPVVFLGPVDPTSPFHPPEEGGGLRAQTADELEAHLRSLLNDRGFRERVLIAQKAFLAKAYAPLDGRAAERVVRLLRRA